MQKVTRKISAAKKEPMRCVAIIVMHGRDVITRRIAPHLEVIREDGQPARVEPLRDVRASIDGPNPQRVAAWPKGAA